MKGQRKGKGRSQVLSNFHLASGLCLFYLYIKLETMAKLPPSTALLAACQEPQGHTEFTYKLAKVIFFPPIRNKCREA